MTLKELKEDIAHIRMVLEDAEERIIYLEDERNKPKTSLITAIFVTGAFVLAFISLMIVLFM